MSPVGGKRRRGGDGGDDVGRQRRWSEALTRAMARMLFHMT